jgi:hypothetical protein
VTDGPFRETTSDLDADARATDAITRLGELRSRIEIRVFIVFLFVGLAICPVAWVAAKELQLAISGRWSLMTSLSSTGLALIATFVVATRVLRALLRRRLPAEMERLAALHQVPLAELARFANVPR